MTYVKLHVSHHDTHTVCAGMYQDHHSEHEIDTAVGRVAHQHNRAEAQPVLRQVLGELRMLCTVAGVAVGGIMLPCPTIAIGHDCVVAIVWQVRLCQIILDSTCTGLFLHQGIVVFKNMHTGV